MREAWCCAQVFAGVDAGTGHIVVAPAAEAVVPSGAGGAGGGAQGSYTEVPDGVAGDGGDVMRTPEMVEVVNGAGCAAGAWGAASAGRYVPVASDGAPVGGGGGTEAAT
jgi:hypothetical protein